MYSLDIRICSTLISLTLLIYLTQRVLWPREQFAFSWVHGTMNAARQCSWEINAFWWLNWINFPLHVCTSVPFYLFLFWTYRFSISWEKLIKIRTYFALNSDTRKQCHPTTINGFKRNHSFRANVPWSRNRSSRSRYYRRGRIQFLRLWMAATHADSEGQAGKWFAVRAICYDFKRWRW